MYNRCFICRSPGCLIGVDRFELVSGGGYMGHAEEALGELLVPGGDGTIDFQVIEVGFDVIAFFVEHAVVLDREPAV